MEGRGHAGAPDIEPAAGEEAQRYRILEREWQNGVGYALLDRPYEAPGSAAVFFRQSERLIDRLDPSAAAVVIEIGCGKGHFLSRLERRSARPWRALVGLDISRAVFSLPSKGLLGVQADGEFLPFRDACVTYVLFAGSLHHVIDYPAALREAIRVLSPGGTIILFEPVSSRFSNLVHRVLDPIVFRKSVVYESPIDLRYKSAFRQDVICHVLRDTGLSVEQRRSDFLAYPFTGCYAGSPFARSERFMRLLMALEDRIVATPVLRRVADALSWRFTIVARKVAPFPP